MLKEQTRIMENKKRFYLVSFGNSSVYRIAYNEEDGENHRSHEPFAKIEKELNDYLKQEFPDKTFTYFTSPKITEISDDEDGKYQGYQELDAKAVEDIKHVLKREIEDMEAVKESNSNAKFSNVDK